MARDRLVHSIGMAGLYLLALSAWSWSAGVDVGLLLMLLATLLQPKLYPILWRQGIGPALVILALYLLGSGLYASLEFPESAGHQATGIYRWSKLLVFFLPAWWISRDRHALNRVFLLSLTGLLLMIIAHLDWANLLALKVSERYGFDISSETNEAGLYSSFYLLALALIAPSVIQAAPPHHRWRTIISLELAVLLLGYALLASQSRQAWLAFALTAPPLIVARYRGWLQQRPPLALRSKLLILLPLLLGLGLVLNNHAFLSERIIAEQRNIAFLLAHGKPAGNTTSVDMRINMQTFGFDQWRRRPVFGWGIGSTRYVTKHSQDPRMWMGAGQGDQGWWLHMHNVYIELLLRMGLVGAFGWAGLFIYLMRVLSRAYRSGQIAQDTMLVLLGMSSIMVIDGWFGFYVGNNRGCVYWLLLAGAIYALKLPRSR